ncbi:MAG TPA: alpha-L-arabinofuranosidase C-terminal domain-containing protein [Bacteroidales bacterium]|nr:alpha-L-arabinofuranosidase C-terminal domain-containing protein [Bacteroidales bacterium]
MKQGRNTRSVLLAIALLSGIQQAPAFAQHSSEAVNTSYRVELYVDKLGIDISPTLNGIFFEDINHGNDGGISAQLIQNNSFQAYNVPGAGEVGPAGKKFPEFSKSPTDIYGWTIVQNGGASGTATIVDDKPLVTYKKFYNFDENDAFDDALKYKQYCVRVNIEKSGKGYGLAANGFGIGKSGPERQGFYYSNNTQVPSIAVNAGVKYDLGLYLQGKDYKGAISVYLEDSTGKRNSNVLKFKGLTDSWKKCTGKLSAQRSVDSRLVVLGAAAGTFYLDFVTLVPEASQLWRNGKVGDFRKDMLEALEKLHPTFMRFPGGCASEGSNYWGQYFWKNTIGPAEERIGVRNHWGYWTSQHIGFYEYFLMAEALGAKPLPVINNGVTCQFAGRSYIAPIGTPEEKQRFYDIYVKDALDLIEFCNGDASTEWGAKRIAFGHPKPFNLEYLAIGNENSGDAFWERFDIVYKAVKEKYPNINVITTAGARASGKEFDANYTIIDQKYPASIVDEHYYSNDNWFYTNTHRYDSDKVRGSENKTFDREKPTRVFVGEFANNTTNNAYISTLAEAAYSTGLERNSDMVVMAAYAPLFCKKGFGKWSSNLIWFDNRGLWRTTNYYYMSMFASNIGNKAIGISPFYKTADQSEDTKVYTSPTLDTKTGVIYVKIVNSENVAKETTVQIVGGAYKNYQVTLEYLTSDDTSIKNQGDQNFYSSAPNVKNFYYNEAITPKTKDLGVVTGSFQISLPVNSVNVIKLAPAEGK